MRRDWQIIYRLFHGIKYCNLISDNNMNNAWRNDKYILNKIINNTEMIDALQKNQYTHEGKLQHEESRV